MAIYLVDKTMTVEEVRANKDLQYSHTASRKGYESRLGNGHVEKYNGRYGKGYIIVTPRWDTKNYVNVEYYLEK